ncbi:Peptidase C39 family [uncultured Roseburia sp.]|uniref:C39 family peptidase n=1 Tax=Brotonthovivens ammoniilytica TaxID=2981725 RepID=A0ABT2TJ20_9FIRM|nr:C39 family peptidase [Brotonthovivens ammoniilytica]MCU6762208.1 C39 family peptidase [Brotonthovivens ammoniilytica]SCI58835.1 Peptidase C39 family [uncultured Roseburia sp.]
MGRRYRKRKKRRMGLVIAAIAAAVLFTTALKYQEGGSFGSGRNVAQARQELRKHSDYPKSLETLLENNPETADFVKNYGNEAGKHHKIDLTKEVKQGEIPLFLQWDQRWGYEYYGNDMIAVDGCGPTCLSMVVAGLTQDASFSPLKAAQFAEQKGFYVEGSGSSWSLMSEGAQKLGLTANEISLDESVIRRELHAGHPIICVLGPGDFTSSGHFIVLTGINNDGTVNVNDPNSKIRSGKTWDLQRIMGQVRNLWSYQV